MSVLRHFTNARRLRSENFRIYAIDSRGGRKLLLEQPASDIAQVGNYDQLFEEDLNRYIGPPIRIMIVTSPGLQASIEKVSF